MTDPPPFSLPCPPTPVMLYIGAGYDLSPLLSFAPGGPPYPIVPLSDQDHAHTDARFVSPDDVYTSFLFVDAKPRVTSSYMVSDFHQWTSIEARVRNILYYAQGSLSRWRTVPGAPDLLWFEGGGDPALVESRSREAAWKFHDPALSDPPVTSAAESLGQSSSPKPLTTLLYLFNTLDIELVRAPLLEHVWPRVEALYVHGLRLHVRTGAGMAWAGHAVPNVIMSSGIDARDSSPGVHRHSVADVHGTTPLGIGLRRCYVIVGSWGTPLRKPRSTRYKGTQAERCAEMGVRHVDFVSEAWRRWKRETRMRVGSDRSCLPLSTPSSSTSSSRLPSTLSPVSPTRLSIAISTSLRPQINVPPSSPIIFRRPRVRSSIEFHRDLHPDGEWDSDYDGDSEDVGTEWSEGESEYSHDQGVLGGGGIVESSLSSSPRISGPFRSRIPQLAWSSTLRGGRGGYYVEKTIEESVTAWRERQGSYAADSEEDESASDGEVNHEEDETRGEMVQKKVVHYLYSLKSFFSIRAHTPPSSPALAHPIRDTSIIPHPPKLPPRSQRRLRPRPPTPAANSEETESENSASETVFGVDHCGDGTGGLWESECQRRKGERGEAYETGPENEKESVVSAFWRRGVLRARRGKEDLNGPVGVCGTGIMTRRSKSMSMSMCHTGSTTTHIASRHSRSPSSKSLDTPFHTSKPPSHISQHRKSRERRIDIADFLSTTSDPNSCDTGGGFSPTDAFSPISIAGSGPVMFSADTARDRFALDSASPATLSFYRTPVSPTLWSFSSPSLSPASLPTTFPRSPYSPLDVFDSCDSVEEKNPNVHSSNPRRSSMLLSFWRRKTNQDHGKKCRARRAAISRSGSISGLFWWKPPVTRLRDGPRGAQEHEPLGHPHTDTACCIIHPGHSHTRARSATHRRFRFDADAPPVPPLPSRFLGHHVHTRSLFDPGMHRGDTTRPYDSHIPRTRARALSSSSPLSARRPPLIVTGDLLDRPVSTPA